MGDRLQKRASAASAKLRTYEEGAPATELDTEAPFPVGGKPGQDVLHRSIIGELNQAGSVETSVRDLPSVMICTCRLVARSEFRSEVHEQLRSFLTRGSVSDVQSGCRLPARDVAALGGWRDLRSREKCYQQMDAATLLRVALDTTKLREKSGTKSGG